MSQNTFKILLIEDDQLDRMAFERQIKREKLPYDCTVAGAVSEARSILGNKEFDVIVSDYSLGDGTALDILALAGKTPVLLVTGAGDEETAVKVWRAGAYDYIIKDIERDYLRNISRAIDNAVRQNELKKLLDRKQKNLVAIFDAAPVCMLLIGEDMTIMRVNEAVRAKVGKEYLEIIGRLPGNALGCVNSIANKTRQCGCSLGCNICLLRKTVNEVFASDKSVHGVEMPLVLATGGRGTEVWFLVNAEPADIDGKKCAVVALQDITARKKAEEAMLASEERYRSIFEQASDGILIFESNSDTMLDFNTKAHESLGYGREEFKKLRISDFEVLHSPEEIKKHIEKIIKEGSDTFETQHRAKSGEVRDVKVTSKIISLGGKTVRQSIWSDVTAQRTTERKLRETMELKSQFISTVSHELRTPLTCIKEAVEVILEGMAGEINDRQRHFLDIVRRNIERLTMLINDVLDFQRLESSRVKIDIRESNVGEVIESVEETLSLAAKQKGLNFAVELDGNLPKVWFDSNKITQVLTNLISNAIKFTPQGGSVTVSILRQADELIIRVRDTGMGIPKEALPKIFDRFYRVPRPGKEIQGTGLGLSIVRKIIDLHRGRVEVESELDKGAVFTVFLPLDARPPREALSRQADEAIEADLVKNS